MHDLSDQLRSYVDAAAEPVTLEECIAVGISQSRNRSPLRAVFAVAAVVVVAAAALVASRLLATTDDQVATDGRGGASAPAGWTPVDWGDGRVYVPPGWHVVRYGTSWHCWETAARHAFLGELVTSAGAPPCEETPAVESLRLETLVESQLTGRDPTTINGYRVLLGVRADGRLRAEVPSLELLVTFGGDAPINRRVLSTLTLSAHAVALNSTTTAPDEWKTVRHHVTVRVPEEWPVEVVTAGQPTSWSTCSGLTAVPPRVYLLEQPLPASSCAVPSPLDPPPERGIAIEHRPDGGLPEPSKRLEVGGIEVFVVDNPAAVRRIDAWVPAANVWLMIGLGDGGEQAAAILRSISVDEVVKVECRSDEFVEASTYDHFGPVGSHSSPREILEKVRQVSFPGLPTGEGRVIADSDVSARIAFSEGDRVVAIIQAAKSDTGWFALGYEVCASAADDWRRTERQSRQP